MSRSGAMPAGPAIAAEAGTAAWRQVGASFALLACSAVVTATYSLLAVPFEALFAVNRLTVMLPITLCSAAAALMSPVLGRALDRGALRPLVMVGCVLLVLGYAALSMVTSFTAVLLIFALLMSPAQVLMGPVAVSVLLSRWFVAKRGRAFGIAMAGISMGGFVFAPIVQALFEGFEWRFALRILALVLAAVSIPAAALIRNAPLGSDAVRASDQPGNPAAKRAILRRREFWLLALIVSLVMGGVTGLVTNLAPYTLGEGLQPRAAAALISVFTGCSLLAKLLFAGLADRIGAPRMVYVVVAGFGAGMAVLLVAPSELAAIGAGVALVGLFGGLMVPLQGLLVARLFGTPMVGQVMGLLSAVILVALLATPPLFGLIFDRTGGYAAVFAAFAALSLVVLLLAAPRLAAAGGVTTRE